jgi:DNA-binding FadR family transcriptional regulator
MVSQLAPVRRTTPSSEGTDRLSEAIGVDRTSIHEVLRILQASDMVTIRPAGGAFVADHASLKNQPLADWESRYQYRSEERFAACLADGVIK